MNASPVVPQSGTGVPPVNHAPDARATFKLHHYPLLSRSSDLTRAGDVSHFESLPCQVKRSTKIHEGELLLFVRFRGSFLSQGKESTKPEDAIRSGLMSTVREKYLRLAGRVHLVVLDLSGKVDEVTVGPNCIVGYVIEQCGIVQSVDADQAR